MPIAVEFRDDGCAARKREAKGKLVGNKFAWWKLLFGTSTNEISARIKMMDFSVSRAEWRGGAT